MRKAGGQVPHAIGGASPRLFATAGYLALSLRGALAALGLALSLWGAPTPGPPGLSLRLVHTEGSPEER